MDSSVKIQFLGATQTVTGSKHVLKTPDMNIMVDCGLFQGLKDLRLKNWNPLPIDISTIDVLVLTHAHLDHCGYIPLLVKAGFKGEIIMTPPTRDLVRIILMDSAKINEEDARQANVEGYTKHHPALPLYTVKDVEKTFKHFNIRNEETWIELSPNISFRYLKNGHILGSVMIDFKCFGKSILFSGDLGRQQSELLDPPTCLVRTDFLIMESTYGDRNHTMDSPRDEMANAVNMVQQQNGTLIIPSFAVGRAQEVMRILSILRRDEMIPDIPIYLDSPMGIDATEVMFKYPGWHKLVVSDCLDMYKDVNLVQNYGETLDLLKDKRAKVVIAASGMLSGGRVLNYLMQHISDPSTIVLFVGYQGEGTRGRDLLEGAEQIKIHGKFCKVGAKIMEIPSMSAHADQQEMLEWLGHFQKKPQKIFLVHGEQTAQETFKKVIEERLKMDVEIPVMSQEFELFKVEEG